MMHLINAYITELSATPSVTCSLQGKSDVLKSLYNFSCEYK